MTKTRLTVALTALLLTGSVAFAQQNMPASAAGGQRISATVDSTATVQAIQAAKFDTRAELLSGLETRMQTADSILAGLTLSATVKDDVKRAAEALTDSIRQARNATAADWEKARSDLSERYTAYAETAVRAEQAAAPAK